MVGDIGIKNFLLPDELFVLLLTYFLLRRRRIHTNSFGYICLKKAN